MNTARHIAARQRRPDLSATIAVLIAATGLVACVPAPLKGEFSEINPQAIVTGGGAPPMPVRWGGVVLSISNLPTVSCFEILGRPLDLSARPKRSDVSEGRFLACRDGFQDPEVFAPGREVTVVGQLIGSEAREIGDHVYQYPTVAASEVYLWQPIEPVQDPIVVDPFLGQYLYAYPYFYYPVVYVTAVRPPQEAGAEAAARAQMRSTASLDAAAARSSMTPRGGARPRR